MEANKNITQATETPQISTETSETVNVSAEDEKKAERAENTPERKIKYFHYTPEQLKRYIIDVYEKYANGEWDRRQEKFIEVNMDFNSPTCGRCFRVS